MVKEYAYDLSTGAVFELQCTFDGNLDTIIYYNLSEDKLRLIKIVYFADDERKEKFYSQQFDNKEAILNNADTSTGELLEQSALKGYTCTKRDKTSRGVAKYYRKLNKAIRHIMKQLN